MEGVGGGGVIYCSHANSYGKLLFSDAKVITRTIWFLQFYNHSRYTPAPHSLGILRNPDSDPDSDSKKTRTTRKPGLGLEKNPDSSLRRAGLAMRKAELEIDKNRIRNWIQNCKALYKAVILFAIELIVIFSAKVKYGSHKSLIRFFIYLPLEQIVT